MVSGNRTDGIRIGIDGINRIVLVLQYDGTRFKGWQIQKNGRTVQCELERALEILVKEEVRVIASGRTDAGVHALGQVVHFDVNRSIDLLRLCAGLNGILDWDISIGNAYYVPHDFHARYSAIEREYLYLIYNHKQRCPFMKYRAMWECAALDIGYLRDVVRNLIGERDFSCFCKKISSGGNTIRRIIDIKISLFSELIVFRIRGNAFLHNMIRVIIGTIIEMFKCNKPPEYITKIIDSKDRDNSGPTAPPYGLYLNRVKYNPPLSSMKSAV